MEKYMIVIYIGITHETSMLTIKIKKRGRKGDKLKNDLLSVLTFPTIFGFQTSFIRFVFIFTYT